MACIRIGARHHRTPDHTYWKQVKIAVTHMEQQFSNKLPLWEGAADTNLTAELNLAGQ